MLAGLLGAPAAAQALGREDFIALGGSVLKIEVLRRQGGYSLGSGVVVAPGRVVTNCHVTRDGVGIEVLRHGQRWPVAAQQADLHHDLCLLQVPGIGADAVARIGRAAGLQLAQPVHAVGFTGGLGLQASDGSVVALHRVDGAPVIRSSNWFTSGASGGGLFDAQRRLVGILTFRLRGGAAHYYAAPVEWVQALLDRAGAEGAGAMPVAPIPGGEPAFWQAPAAAQPAFLRADALLRDGRWAELAQVAAAWIAEDPRDPQAWLARARADDEQGRAAAAQAGYERALALDARLAEAWLRLGLLQQRAGALAEARAALRALQPLDDAMAAQLAEGLGADAPR
ncbi:hypothetical protein ISF6_1710 [Piscinibacter sakaiensis]|uniref:Uncharacterized protein n=1 Tax=Piscinibacter sakaiensis TaxID=1547922 RepID=A0A0K8NU68_PISS1|nr:hypothetical protein ISF6_1710 [Piscinibacter sakaiensis]